MPVRIYVKALKNPGKAFVDIHFSQIDTLTFVHIPLILYLHTEMCEYAQAGKDGATAVKAYQTDDGEIRFYFDKQDIAVHNLEFSDLIVSSAKSRELLALLLRYAHERFGFNPKGNHLTIGAIPLGTDHFLLTLSDKDATRFPGLSQAAAERDDESDEAGAAELYDEDDSLLPESAKEVSSEELLSGKWFSDSDSQDDDFWSDLASGANIRDDSAQGEVVDAGNADGDATAPDAANETNDDNSEEGFRSFLQYMMGFLSDDHDQAPATAGNGNWQGAGNDPEGEAVNEDAAAAAEARAQKRAAAKDRKRTKEKVEKNAGTAVGMFNFSKLENLLAFAEAAEPLKVDSMLLYDDVEHCYHLCMMALPSGEDDFRRARNLAAEFGTRTSGVAFRYYREQFPCIAEHDALEMLRNL